MNNTMLDKAMNLIQNMSEDDLKKLLNKYGIKYYTGNTDVNYFKKCSIEKYVDLNISNSCEH